MLQWRKCAADEMGKGKLEMTAEKVIREDSREHHLVQVLMRKTTHYVEDIPGRVESTGEGIGDAPALYAQREERWSGWIKCQGADWR